MATEGKWVLVWLGLMFGGIFIGMGMDQYQKSQCRIEAIRAGVEADKINAACGLK